MQEANSGASCECFNVGDKIRHGQLRMRYTIVEDSVKKGYARL
jgi:hypothetical protein